MIVNLSRSELEQAQKDKTHLSGLKCPACHEEKSRVLRVCIRSQPDTPVFVCGHCRLQFIEPQWNSEAELRDYYRTQYREHHEARLGTLFTPQQRHEHQKLFMLESVKNFKEKIPEGGSVLELGCSAGGFLEHLKGRHELYGLKF